MAPQTTDKASTHSMEKDLEKVDYIEVNHNKYANIGLTAEETDFYENYPEEARKKMIRKIDVRLVPVLALLYLMVSPNEITWCYFEDMTDACCSCA
jgi:hypothetical protein